MPETTLTIVPLSPELLADVNRSNQPFTVFGRLVPTFDGSSWSWTEEFFAERYQKQYPAETLDYGQYIDNPDKAMFLAYRNHTCVGQIRLSRNWNGFCLVEDIAVGRDYRAQGVGSRLLEIGSQWARAGGMGGLMLETQDINLAACRFYQHHGFLLGGVDKLLYHLGSSRGEVALFWYKTW